MLRIFHLAVLGSFAWCGCLVGFDADKLTGGNAPRPPGEAGETDMALATTGYTWSKNSSSASDANRARADGVNDGNLSVGVNVNPHGEGGAELWEAAGVMWSTPTTLGSVTFVNGAIDSYRNGYFERGCKLQFTTDGTTWFDSGWAITPSYPNSARAGGQRYTFSGAAASGLVGARVTGLTGSDSWSWIVNEVQLSGD
jgi:hypothetical protein